MSAPRDVVITGLGAVCSLGDDCDAFAAALADGRCGIRPITRFDTTAFSVHTGALVERAAQPQTSTRELTGQLCRDFAVPAAIEALEAAALPADIPPGRVALLFGTGIADLQRSVHQIAEDIAVAIGSRGPRITVSTACSSSTAAIGLARDLLAMGAADVVVAGGADVLTPEVFAGFHALGVLTAGKCAPFSRPAGTTLGEGAGFLILERGEAARARGARIVATLSGYGLSADAWHETSPDPKGSGVERAITMALEDAGVSAREIGYVNAHGSGTEANDQSEWLAMQRVLCDGTASVPMSSTKGAIGHAQGAAGVLEAIATLLAMQHDTVPPTLNFSLPRTRGPADPVAATKPRPARWEHALALNSAFGGSNAALVLSREARHREPHRRRALRVAGVGMVGPNGSGPHAFGEWGTAPAHPARRVAPIEIETIVPSIDPRGLDPSSRYLIAAAALGLRDACLSVRGTTRDRVGLFVGQLRGSAASLQAFQRSIDERGLRQVSPSAFARIVLNAAAGACARALSIRGPLTALTTGEGSSLVALVLAAEHLSTRTDVDWILAAGSEEHEPDDADLTSTRDEGAACVVLATEDATESSARSVLLLGWGIAGPGCLDVAIARATQATPGAVAGAELFRAEDASAGGGVSGTIAIAAAIEALREGAVDRALVTSCASASATVAVLLERPRVAA